MTLQYYYDMLNIGLCRGLYSQISNSSWMMYHVQVGLCQVLLWKLWPIFPYMFHMIYVTFSRLLSMVTVTPSSISCAAVWDTDWVITVVADDLAPNGARASAVTLLTTKVYMIPSWFLCQSMKDNLSLIINHLFKMADEILISWLGTSRVKITHCGLMMPYGDIYLGQCWPRW